jgi:hypothetical protein
MTEHISQEILEKLLIDPGHVDSLATREADAHLAKCAYCREVQETLRAFHAELAKELQAGPSSDDAAFAERLITRLRRRGLALLPERGVLRKSAIGVVNDSLGNFADIIEPYRHSASQRLVRYVLVHPVRVAMSTISLAIVAATILLMIVRSPRDTNPDHCIVKGQVLSVMNRGNDVLWTRYMPGVLDGAEADFRRPTERGARFVGMEDIDGKGRNVVLTFVVQGFAQDTLYCYEGDGSLRWAAWAGAPVAFGTKTFALHAQMGFHNFAVLRNRHGGRPRLFAVLVSSQFFPSRLVELDPVDGHEVGSYWHAGAIEKLCMYDIDDDGNDEILIGGLNEFQSEAFVALLKPGDLTGCGPVPREDLPAGLTYGHESYYLVFPTTDLGRIVSPEPFNVVRGIVPGARPYFQVYVDEGYKSDSGPNIAIVYTLDSAMRVVNVAVGNAFEKMHAEYFAQRRLSGPCDRAYRERLGTSVRYWDGDAFVKHYTPNKRSRFIEAARR